MMKARELVWNQETGIATATTAVDEEKRTVGEEVQSVDVRAGDDVRVRADGLLVRVESLTDHPLLVRRGKDRGTVIVQTARRPDLLTDDPEAFESTGHETRSV